MKYQSNEGPNMALESLEGTRISKKSKDRDLQEKPGSDLGFSCHYFNLKPIQVQTREPSKKKNSARIHFSRGR